MRRKLLVGAALVVLLAAGAAYKLVLSPAHAAKEPKIRGTLYTLADPFLVNLEGGHYGKLSVALLLSKAPPAASDGTAALPQLAAVRAVITDVFTGRPPSGFVRAASRRALLRKLLEALQQRTDEPITAVYLTDITVQ